MSSQLMPVVARPETSRATEPAAEPVVRVQPDPVRQRLQALDVYRGLVMVTLAFNGFGLAATALNHAQAQVLPYVGASVAGSLALPGGNAALLASTAGVREKTAALRAAGGSSSGWETLRAQLDHVEWTGCVYWDLIQPSFMFMVGAAMAFSYLKRRQQGDSYLRMLGHAFTRSLVLIFLGIFLISNNQKTTDWSLMCVLSQIGLGYTFLFLLWGRSYFTQGFVALAILVATWWLYVSYPQAGVNIETGAPAVGISAAWAQEHLQGVPPAWHKNANVGHAVDVWLLNRLPVAEPFVYNRGGYQTLNFLPSLATMIFGLMCGELLRSSASGRFKLLVLLGAGAVGLAAGVALDVTGVCPIIKRIWTPAWALFSTGWCCLILAGLYGLIDVLGYRRWTFPLVVVGVNSIVMYCLGMTLRSWTAGMYRTHFGPGVFGAWGPLNEPALQAILVGLFFWLVCLWLYRQKIFVRI